MGYQGIMGYGVDFPLSRLGKAIILWVIRVYGLREVWVKRVSTVTIHSDVRAYRSYYYILNAGRLNTTHTATESQKHEDNELSLELARATIS